MITLVDGLAVSTGLLVPDQRPETFAAYSAALPILTENQIEDVLLDDGRQMGRKRFGKAWIRNQGRFSSCNGYAGAKALERARELRGLPRVALSGEGLYAQISGGRDQGSMLDDGMHAMQDFGIPPEDLVEHGTYRWNAVSDKAKSEARKYRGFECYRVDTELELVSGLCLGFVGVVAVHAGNNFVVDKATGLVYRSLGSGNHAVGVDDAVLTSNGFWFDMFNSWGGSWGTDGRGYLTWEDHFATTVRNHAFYLIRSTSDGDDEVPPLQGG